MKRFWIKLAIIIAVIAYLRCLPDPLYNSSYSQVIFSREGQLLSAHTSSDGQWRFPESMEVPEKFAKALITFEDKRFYRHFGIDILAIGRAFKQNIRAGKVVSGGSTLTMQLMRLAAESPPRTIKHKIIESIQATRAEIKYTKEELLGYYASHAPFGGNVVGLDAASWRYFGKSKNHLTWAESAMLAVLPNAPSLIHPGKNREHLKDKRNRLLRKLWKEDVIDSLTYELAILEKIPEQPKRLPMLASHLLHDRQLKTGYTSLNYSMQKESKNIVDYHHTVNRQKGIQNAAVLVMDNTNGEILVYVGNTAGRQHENAVDMIRSARSSGSILKPFLYAMAIDEGMISPEQLLPDVPINLGGFNPKNYNKKYYGAVKASDALARSLNVPAVHLLQEYGVEKFLLELKRLGITTLSKSGDHYGLSLILGGGEVSLWELVQAYSYLSQSLIQYGTDAKMLQKAQLLSGLNTEVKTQLSPGSIYTTFEAMRQVVRPDEDGYWETFNSSKPLAWKTGTSYGHRDAWAIGCNPQYTIGVWVGNADGEGRPENIGSKAAGSMLFDILNILPAPDPAWFPKPHDDLREKEICSQSGMPSGKYCTEIVNKLLPKSSLHVPACPYHKKVFLDPTQSHRVYRHCANSYIDTSWFSLPADMAYYYRLGHPEYVPLPPFSHDCQKNDLSQPMVILYPKAEESIYLPKGLNGQKNSTVARVVHRDQDASIFWHMDGSYLGITNSFHEWSFQLQPGTHTLMVMDQAGYKVSRTFHVLGEEWASAE